MEFAIVLPLLALLLIGLIDFGRYTYTAILAANAARAGVQYGAQNLEKAEDTPGIIAAAAADTQGFTGLTTTPTPYCLASGAIAPCSTSGSVAYVKVVTTGIFSPLVKYPGLPATVTVTGSAVMRVENQ